MPIIKQAIKRVKQAKVRTARNKHYTSRMKSMVKLILGYIQKGEAEQAKKIQPKVMSAIDTCTKKNLIHKNNAARKKSRIQKALGNIGNAPKVVEKTEKKKEEKAEKSVSAKKAVKQVKKGKKATKKVK